MTNSFGVRRSMNLKKSGIGSFIGQPPPSSEIFIAMSQGNVSCSSSSNSDDPDIDPMFENIISDSCKDSQGIYMACDEFSSYGSQMNTGRIKTLGDHNAQQSSLN